MGKAERTKQFIIEQAAPLFNEKGIAGTSIDDVLKATKVAKGCLYGHFDNKEALSHETVDYMFGKLLGHCLESIAKASGAKAKLLVFLDLYASPLNPPFSGGCPILNFGVESDDTDPVIRQKVKTVIQKTLKIFADVIRQGVANKELSPAIHPEEFALKMFALTEGAMMVSRVMNSNKHMHMALDMIRREIESYEL